MQQPQVPQVLIAIRKLDGVWESAILVQGNLDRTLTGGSLPDLITRALAQFTEPEMPNDTRLMLTFNMSLPQVEEAPSVLRP